jgi:hypothetical protein
MVTKWKVLGETTPLRKLEIKDFEADDGMLKSNNYNNKVRHGRHVRFSTFGLPQHIDGTKLRHVLRSNI